MANEKYTEKRKCKTCVLWDQLSSLSNLTPFKNMVTKIHGHFCPPPPPIPVLLAKLRLRKPTDFLNCIIVWEVQPLNLSKADRITVAISAGNYKVWLVQCNML
jgi:hypothetical protein